MTRGIGWYVHHQGADHGLVRLMEWERSVGPGLGLAPLRTPGPAGFPYRP